MSIIDEWSREAPDFERKPKTYYHPTPKHEMTNAEIAAELGLEVNSVKTYVKRAMKKLRQHPELMEWL